MHIIKTSDRHMRRFSCDSDHGLCGSNKLLYKRSMGEGEFRLTAALIFLTDRPKTQI